MSLCETILIGHLGADPEMKYTKNQNAILTISVGVQEKLPPTARKETKAKTHWHRCRRWGKQAEELKPKLKKGDKVFIKGTLIYDTWEDRTGTKHKDAIIEIYHLEKMYFENISIDLS